MFNRADLQEWAKRAAVVAVTSLCVLTVTGCEQNSPTGVDDSLRGPDTSDDFSSGIALLKVVSGADAEAVAADLGVRVLRASQSGELIVVEGVIANALDHPAVEAIERGSKADLAVGRNGRSNWIDVEPFGPLADDHLGGLEDDHLGGLEDDHLGGLEDDHLGGLEDDHLGGLEDEHLGGLEDEHLGGLEDDHLGGLEDDHLGGLEARRLGWGWFSDASYIESLGIFQSWNSAVGRDVKVAVIDTGVEPDHPHLQGRLELLDPSTGFSSVDVSNGRDDDGDGFVDEGYGHGTHVAGTILTVAPNVTILPIRALDDEGVGYVSEIAAAMLLAADLGADIINLSVSFDGYSPIVAEILAELRGRGIEVIAAAGNRLDEVAYPASDPNSVSVTAVTADDIGAKFVWNNGADVAAPGVNILNAFPGGFITLASGTSMATAVATGCVALLSEGQSTAMARQSLLANAVPTDPTLDVRYGRVDPWAALQAQPDSHHRSSRSTGSALGK